MNRTYEYRCLPGKGQEKDLEQMLYLTRVLYNAALQERIECYNKTGVTITRFDQTLSLTKIRQENPEWAQISVEIARGALTTLDNAFKGFWGRLKAGKKPGFPKFKGKAYWRSLHFNATKIRLGNKQWGWIKVKGVRNSLKIYLHRDFPVNAAFKQSRLVKDVKGWKFQVVLELPDVKKVDAEGTIGLDVGVAHFVTTSEGEHFDISSKLKRSESDLKAAQRSLARKQRGSNNRQRQKEVVARWHNDIKNKRKYGHYQIVNKLIDKRKDFQVEDLQITNMTKSAKGTLDAPGKRVSAKSGLNKTILDQSWAAFNQILDYKAQSAGLTVEKVSAQNTSRQCSQCGYITKDNRKTQSGFNCVQCGYSINADINAAINIGRKTIKKGRLTVP